LEGNLMALFNRSCPRALSTTFLTAMSKTGKALA